jgi:hypothetical protein
MGSTDNVSAQQPEHDRTFAPGCYSSADGDVDSPRTVGDAPKESVASGCSWPLPAVGYL